MKYIIKHKNDPVIKFDLLENLADSQEHITWITEDNWNKKTQEAEINA